MNLEKSGTHLYAETLCLSLSLSLSFSFSLTHTHTHLYTSKQANDQIWRHMKRQTSNQLFSIKVKVSSGFVIIYFRRSNYYLHFNVANLLQVSLVFCVLFFCNKKMIWQITQFLSLMTFLGPNWRQITRKNCTSKMASRTDIFCYISARATIPC